MPYSDFCKGDPARQRRVKMDYHINRQIGDYVVYSKEANKAPFFVRMAGDESPISTHWNVTDAVKEIQIYQAADKRRARSA